MLLGLFVYLLWRYANLSAWHITACVLFGCFLASPSIGPHIWRLLTAAVHYIAGLVERSYEEPVSARAAITFTDRP